MAQNWEARGQSKRKAILDTIPAEWRLEKIPSAEEQKDVTGTYVQQFLSAQEIEVTETDAVGIAENVAAGKWKAYDVTRAFCHRAALAHQLLNCLHETFFDAALADAQKLDAYYEEHKKTVGPMHGVPVSLKDQFHVKGVDTSMGYIGWLDTFQGQKDHPKHRVFESEMVRELRQLGAILFCKTSVPHSLMAGETINNIIEYTWNPKNRFLSSGGSSGGEGALIGIRGSPVGLGSDIGGSIRIPAAFNGLYGLRPSAGRFSYEGTANSMDGQNSLLSVLGPLGTTARSVRFIAKSLISTKPWLFDPLTIEMPWRDAEEQAIRDIVGGASGSKLAFGVLTYDGSYPTQPPVARAISMVAEALSKAGHTIVEWKPPSHERGINLAFATWRYDGGRDVRSAFDLSGESMASQITGLYGDVNAKEFTATEIAATNIAKREYQKEYMDYWNSTAELTGTGRPVDGLLTACAPYAAARPFKYKYYGYSVFVNTLDYTSVVVPVMTADKNIDKYPEGYTPSTTNDQAIYEDYDAEIYDGAHVSVQIVGRRFTEEKMLAIAEYVGGLMGK